MISFLLLVLWWLVGFVFAVIGIRECEERALIWSDVAKAAGIGLTGPIIPALFVLFVAWEFAKDGVTWVIDHPVLSQPVFTTKAAEPEAKDTPDA